MNAQNTIDGACDKLSFKENWNYEEPVANNKKESFENLGEKKMRKNIW